MPHLKEVLGRLPNFRALPLPPAPTRLQSAKKDIAIILGATTPRQPSTYDLMETYQVIVGMPLTAEAFADLPTKHIKRTPWVLFESPRKDFPCLADNNDLLIAYLDGLERRLFSPAIVILALAFLRHYPVAKPQFDYLRKRISALVSGLTTLRGRSLAQRAERFGFFWAQGSIHFGALLADSHDPSQLIAEAGFDEDNSQRGFVLASVKKMIERFSLDLRHRKVHASKLANFLAFLTAEPVSSAQMRFPSLRAATAEALLTPFESQSPEPDIEEGITHFLLWNYGDPRIHSGNWHAVSEDARAVLMRWLVSGTLEDFFRVVREGSHQDRDADRMWPYREAFWTAYLKKGVISDAWVILGDMIAQRSRDFLSEQKNSYGKFARGAGVTNVHAALIMRIGDLVITEWNYSGKYRVWQADQVTAPKFYRAMYTKGDLIRGPDFEKTHHGAEKGSWQGSLASYIANQTGIRVTSREYMPK